MVRQAIFFLLFVTTAESAFEWNPGGARSVSLGGSLCALRSDVHAAAVNPALLGTTLRRSLGVLVSPGAFSLEELAWLGAVYVEPVGAGGVLAAFSRFGSDLYRETRVGVSFGTAISPTFSAGLRMDFDHLSVSSYGATSCGALSAAFEAAPVRTVVLTVLVENALTTKPPGSPERPPLSLHLAISVSAPAGIRLVAKAVKDDRFLLETGLGAEIALHDAFTLRTGATIDPATWSAGVGLHVAAVDFDYALVVHFPLGVTHYISFSFRPTEL